MVPAHVSATFSGRGVIEVPTTNNEPQDPGGAVVVVVLCVVSFELSSLAVSSSPGEQPSAKATTANIAAVRTRPIRWRFHIFGIVPLASRPSVDEAEAMYAPSLRWSLGIVASVLVLGAGVAGCSSDANGGWTNKDQGSEATTTMVQRPEDPQAQFRELSGGGGAPILGEASKPQNFTTAGFVEHEFEASGSAASYRSAGALPGDGRYELLPRDSASYRTRVVVRRPSDVAKFNGTVVVEWLNVSGGLDANPDFSMMAEELIRGGYAWVGVSAQHIGVEGGKVAVPTPGTESLAGKGLKAMDPPRYSTLAHPGDAYSFDIYTQVARSLRTGAGAGAGEPGPLGDLIPQRLLAVGESQSAFELTTYVNGVQPLTKMFDGFLIHSRGGAAAPLGEPGSGVDIAASIGGAPTIVRTDTDVPVLVLETESEVLSFFNYFPARQDDTDKFRLWEMAGTAHADAHLLGPLATSMGCGTPVNNGPHHFIVKAALRSMNAWIRDGAAPAKAPRIDVNAGALVRDSDGIVKGGIRTPVVDVPSEILSAQPSGVGGTICMLMGTTTPLSAQRLGEMYPSRSEYQQRFDASLNSAIASGFVLAEDRDAFASTAHPERVAG